VSFRRRIAGVAGLVVPPLAAVAGLLAVPLACVAAFSTAAAEPASEVVLATTTSVRDSGLLDVLLPPFHARTGIDVKVIAVGSGAALRMARDGNADLVLAHAPEAEEALVKDGFAVDRRALAENFFVIAGPAEDPARVREATSAADAITRIFHARAPFVSRGDDSGTHQRERTLLTAAGLPAEASGPGVVRTGSGMGPTLQVAGEKRAYVLTDEGTFRSLRARIGLVALTGRDPALRNAYSVLRVAPGRFAPGQIRAENATRLADHLLSAESREAIARFGAAQDEGPLFTPLAGAPAP
jgi:tungstate transport system substrate-binding protein